MTTNSKCYLCQTGVLSALRISFLGLCHTRSPGFYKTSFPAESDATVHRQWIPADSVGVNHGSPSLFYPSTLNWVSMGLIRGTVWHSLQRSYTNVDITDKYAKIYGRTIIETFKKFWCAEKVNNPAPNIISCVQQPECSWECLHNMFISMLLCWDPLHAYWHRARCSSICVCHSWLQSSLKMIIVLVIQPYLHSKNVLHWQHRDLGRSIVDCDDWQSSYGAMSAGTHWGKSGGVGLRQKIHFPDVLHLYTIWLCWIILEWDQCIRIKTNTSILSNYDVFAAAWLLPTFFFCFTGGSSLSLLSVVGGTEHLTPIGGPIFTTGPIFMTGVARLDSIGNISTKQGWIVCPCQLSWLLQGKP